MGPAVLRVEGHDLLEGLEEPVNLYFYYSDEATQSMPSLRSYADRVREMLEEFESAADGNIRLSVIDPLPFSEDEDRAAQFGLQGVQLEQDPAFVAAVEQSEDPLYTPILAKLPPETSIADYVTSVTVTAALPSKSCCG